MITFGIDTHKGTLAVSAIDDTGREVGARTFPNTVRGHGALVAWAGAIGSLRRFGIEGSGSYGAALARLLVATGESVVEVPSTLTARERRSLRRAGKSDAGDALTIARVALREPDRGPVPMPGLSEDLKLLVDAREQAVSQRTRVLNRLHAHLVVLLPGYGRTVPNLAASRHRHEVARLLERQGGTRAELARAELVRADELDAQCLALEGRIRTLVRLSGSSLPTIPGVAAITAAKLMGETGGSSPLPLVPRVRRHERHRTHPGVLGSDEPTPAQPGRQPSAEPVPPCHRAHAVADRSAGEGLYGETHGRKQVMARGAALSQAPLGQRRAAHDARRCRGRARWRGLDDAIRGLTT
jgi:transposase